MKPTFESPDILGNGSGQSLDDVGIGVEEIITSHSRLAGNTSGNDDNVNSLQGILQLIVSLVSSDLAIVEHVGIEVGDDVGVWEGEWVVRGIEKQPKESRREHGETETKRWGYSEVA